MVSLEFSKSDDWAGNGHVAYDGDGSGGLGLRSLARADGLTLLMRRIHEFS